MTLRHIDHYQYHTSNVLGEGSTGTVYRGKDSRTGKEVAIKAIDMKNVDNEVTKYLLENQIKSLQITNHPNVLRALDVIKKPDFCYVVTDIMLGKTLHEMIKARGRIPENQALSIFKGIVNGYAEIQRHRITHRDLKPENIMLSPDGNPVICDFGYSEIAGYLAKPKMFYNVGSPAYMAPESIVGSVYNENTEVWSLGMILYEMLEGKAYVSNDKEVMQLFMKMKKSGLVYPAGASEFAKGILRDTLKLKPTDRISIKDLVSKLSSVPNLKNGQQGLQQIQPNHQLQPQVPQGPQRPQGPQGSQGPQITQPQFQSKPQQIPPTNQIPPPSFQNQPFPSTPSKPLSNGFFPFNNNPNEKLNMTYNIIDHSALTHPDTPTKRPISSDPVNINNPFSRNTLPTEPSFKKQKVDLLPIKSAVFNAPTQFKASEIQPPSFPSGRFSVASQKSPSSSLVPGNFPKNNQIVQNPLPASIKPNNPFFNQPQTTIPNQINVTGSLSGPIAPRNISGPTIIEQLPKQAPIKNIPVFTPSNQRASQIQQIPPIIKKLEPKFQSNKIPIQNPPTQPANTPLVSFNSQQIPPSTNIPQPQFTPKPLGFPTQVVNKPVTTLAPPPPPNIFSPNPPPATGPPFPIPATNPILMSPRPSPPVPLRQLR